MGNQLTRRFIQHPGVRTGFCPILNQSPDASVLNLLVQTQPLDLRANPTAFGRPLRLLNDSPVHIDDVQIPVRPGVRIDGPEMKVGRGNEFLLIIDVDQLRFSFGVHHVGASDNAGHGFANQVIAHQISR